MLKFWEKCSMSRRRMLLALFRVFSKVCKCLYNSTIHEEHVYKIKTATEAQSTAWRNARALSRYNELGLTNQSACSASVFLFGKCWILQFVSHTLVDVFCLATVCGLTQRSFAAKIRLCFTIFGLVIRYFFAYRIPHKNKAINWQNFGSSQIHDSS